ncbi:MAG: F0F1 ATP synthase subunit epsilon, partial [Lachnospiraceae bacterium]|nr:F0F1 ATP synthase subunit epsilon [Lachnospiraceae bacterium]
AEYALQKARERLENRDSQTDLALAETALKRAIARIEVLK